MNILFADVFAAAQLGPLHDAGHGCEYAPALTVTELPGAIRGFDVLVVRSTRVDTATLEAGDRLKLVIRAGAGTDTIDKVRARALDIDVCNVPGANALAVAELTLGLIIAADRRIPDNVADLRNGIWNKKGYAAARGLFGSSLGVVGLGRIGLAVAERASAFGMHILALTSTYYSGAMQVRHAGLEVSEFGSLGALAEHSDFLTLHLPGNAQTRGLIGPDVFARMRSGAVLINTSRANIVDTSALIEAMDTKNIRAAVDVFDGEPASGAAPFDCLLARHPNLYGTHHIGASTEQAQHAVAAGVIDIITAFAKGEIKHCVNAA